MREARQGLYRGLILEAAEAAFALHGVEGSKMEAIAGEAGLSLGTVYAVFSGKDEIVDALHEARLREMLDVAIAAARGSGSPLELLVAGVRAYVEYFLHHPDYLRMYIADGTTWGVRSALSSQPRRARAWEEGIALQARLFERGISEGIFADGNPDQMARMMAAIQQVQLADWLESDLRADPELLILDIERQLRRSFCTDAHREAHGGERPGPPDRGPA